MNDFLVLIDSYTGAFYIEHPDIYGLESMHQEEVDQAVFKGSHEACIKFIKYERNMEELLREFNDENI